MKKDFLKMSLIAVVVAVCVVSTLRSSVASPTPGAPPDGAVLFGAKCSICHGKDGTGTPMRAKGAPNFTDAAWQTSHTDAQITERIKAGKAPIMPSFKGKLSDVEISTIVARIRKFKK